MGNLKLFEQARLHGSRLAIRQGTSDITYADLLKRSERIASALLDAENDLNESRIALLCPSAQEFAISQWGIWRAGGVCVPMSNSATASELEYAISNSRPIRVLAQREYFEKLEPVCKKLGVAILVLDEAISEVVKPLPSVTSNRRAMILYTSGTTSKPKGVVTTHRNIESQICSLVEAWGWKSVDRIPLFLPLHHIHGIVNVLSCALWTGAQVDAFDSFDMPAVLDRIANKDYSLFMAVPTIYVKLIQALEGAEHDQQQAWIDGFRSLRLMVSGSAALPASVHEKWTTITGQVLLERYGMTEIGMALSNPLNGERRPGAVGIPLPNVEIRLKSEAGSVLKNENEPGEIQVRGPAIFQEYWDRSEATMEAFDEGWFRTGDMAVLEKGYYRIMGRLSVDILKSGGYKLSALEIEEVLMQHPQILECAVVGIPDDTWGDAVAAAVVCRDDQSMDIEALRDWCRQRMSPYKIPKLIKLVADLPRNAMGKIVKPAVKTLFT